jgi:hypothetical protein
MQKNIELSNKDSIVLNIPMHDHDKRVFVTTDQTGLITGLNFHFGVDDTTAQDLQFFSVPCPHLTEIFKRLIVNKSDLLRDSKCFKNHNKTHSAYYFDNADRLELNEIILKAIDLYVQAFIIQ